MWEWILHQDGQARVIKGTGQLLWNPPWTVKNNCLWSLCGFRSLGSDFTMLLPGNEESHLCCFCMDSLSFGETQNTLAHTRETLLYWDAARHRSEICCCGISPHYTHGVRDNIWDTNLSFQHMLLSFQDTMSKNINLMLLISSWDSEVCCTIVMKCKTADILCYLYIVIWSVVTFRLSWDQWSCRFSELPDSRTAIRTGLCLINVAWLLSASLAIPLLQNQWWTLGRVEETWRTPFFLTSAPL